MSRTPAAYDDIESLIQRFINSLQVLVLLLPPIASTDSTTPALAEAARQALGDAERLRARLRRR